MLKQAIIAIYLTKQNLNSCKYYIEARAVLRYIQEFQKMLKYFIGPTKNRYISEVAGKLAK